MLTIMENRVLAWKGRALHLIRVSLLKEIKSLSLWCSWTELAFKEIPVLQTQRGSRACPVLLKTGERRIQSWPPDMSSRKRARRRSSFSFMLAVRHFWEEPASSRVSFGPPCAVSQLFWCRELWKESKKKLKNLLFKRCHMTCLSTASSAPRCMPQFLFSLQVLHIHVMERIVCLVKDIWCCPCIY
jgi:hypothetical protein